MDARPLTSTFGVEIIGCDVRGLVASEAGRAELRRLLDAHQILLMRGQGGVSEAEQVEVAAAFGDVADEMGKGTKVSFISSTRDDAISGSGEGYFDFHSDYSWRENPLEVITMFGLEVTDESVPTLFASACCAYEALPLDLARRLDGLKGVHLRVGYARLDNLTARGAVWKPGFDLSDYPHFAQPVVLTHPVTGRKLLYVSNYNVSHIEGMERTEGEALLDELASYVTAENNIYEHRWQRDDLLIWDNIALQHARKPATPAPRTLRRAVTCASGFRSDLGTRAQLRKALAGS